jgi:phenylacetate-CoA ligase
MIDQVYSSFVRHVLLPAGDLVFGQRMMRRLKFLESAQWWEPERIAGERDRAIEALVKTAYQEVPFYRFLMDREKIRPGDIRGIKDLPRFPIVTKEQLRDESFGRPTRSTGRSDYAVTTSGSTGTNFSFREDSETFGWYLATAMLTWGWAGWEPGYPHVQTGINPARDLKRRLKDRLLRCQYVSAYDLKDDSLTRHLERMERTGARFLLGYPGSLYYLARHARVSGWNIPMKGIVTWGDNLYSHYRKEIETAFGVDVHDTYGMSEGMQIAAQCSGGGTYHVLSLDVAAEIVNEDGGPASANTPGSIVVTRLHPGPMPFIRYRTGDIGVRGSRLVCGCGRGFELLERIHGRETDVVLTPGGNRLVVHFFTGILENFRQIGSFQVVQEELESIILRIVPGEGFNNEVSTAIVDSLRTHGAGDLRILIEEVREIPLAQSQKRRFVVSTIGKRHAPTVAKSRLSEMGD